MNKNVRITKLFNNINSLCVFKIRCLLNPNWGRGRNVDVPTKSGDWRVRDTIRLFI
jgi:hypothetical protein